MAVIDTTKAIRAVTKLLISRLNSATGITVDSLRPEKAAGESGPRLNLFLYELDQPGDMRGVILDPDQPTPLWLCLKYLLTAFDEGKESDTLDAQGLLGHAMSVLQSLNFLDYSSAVDPDLKALDALPDRLKVTFDPATPDLLSKLMQGSDEKYRLSAAFHVRPVLILPPVPPKIQQLVGIDYSDGGKLIGRAGIQTPVTASMGPKPKTLGVVLKKEKKDGPESILPQDFFEPGAELEIAGDNLDLGGLDALLGGVPVSVISQRAGSLRLKIEGPRVGAAALDLIKDGSTLSAGHHQLVLRQQLSNGRYRPSAPLGARLLPVVTAVTAPAALPGDLEVEGHLLGTLTDDVEVCLCRDGKVLHVFNSPVTAPAPTAGQPQPQDRLLIHLITPGPVTPGPYLVVVSVNGQQARNSPAVIIS